ncbi:MAG: hypothetical protein LBU79_03515 [Planctomycetota bacterium]|nr:hypothetical protein [Planctomycetota bacterium]
MNTRLKVVLAGAVHPNMPGDDRGVIEKAITEMQVYAKKYAFDLAVWKSPISSEDNAEEVRRFCEAEEADFTLLINASLPFGRIMLPLAKVRGRLGFWSFPEPTRDGVLQLNSFCGVNLMGSLLSHYSRRPGVPGKWFYGQPESPMFAERLRCTIRALQAIKGLGSLRIGQIGGLANGFENMYVDERDLESKFGTYLQTRHSVEEIVARAVKLPDSQVAEEIAKARAEAKRVTVSDEHLAKSTRVFMACRDFARENRYDALAISCWARFQEVYGIAVCGAMSRLNEQGILAVCEADIFSTVCMAAMKAMTGEKPALNDLVSLDESDNSLNLWHCGVAPTSWADSKGVTWDCHFNIGHYDGKTWCGDGMVADMNFRPGPVTIVSMGGRFDRLFLVTGEVMAGKPGYAGSSGWVKNIAINGQAVDIPVLINSIATHGVNHHYSTSYQDLTFEWNEFAAWMGIAVLPPLEYKPYVQSSPV